MFNGLLLIGEMLGGAGASPWRRAIGTAAAGTVLVAVLMCFGWFWPIWTDQLVTNSEWVQRMWFPSWF